jgi:hypothetical protein
LNVGVVMSVGVDGKVPNEPLVNFAESTLA